MSKYSALWKHFLNCAESEAKLSFSEIEKLAGVPLDHSFLTAKKELEEYGWRVKKISLKEETVALERIESKPSGREEE